MVSTSLLALLAAALTYAFYLEVNKAPAVPDEPKQSHHAVYFRVCGELRGVIVTTHPPVVVKPDTEFSPELFELITKTTKDRIVVANFTDRWCPFRT